MDIISDFLTARASIITRSIGEFQLDAVTVESHSSMLRLTENPIESGAAIADYAILEPKEITVIGIMVGYGKHKNLWGNYVRARSGSLANHVLMKC
ncbi:hypothetical protein BB987_06220 [Photorhabdus temperata]|uniref:Dit-like phage tail protein N-terminal domain-containing protein n=1 Tax=Photorhabdus khanii NC19 TaxID=1004151 RepID=W3V5P2_9GAMM|nr:hypothetical protein [Photorhabdus khanii]ETS31157.1 hypothetical protein PTE_03111 [Photorhabdus khanii NC19]OHV55996.1 hypothetical protein BB987_06220 [Photorhabdus temperata]